MTEKPAMPDLTVLVQWMTVVGKTRDIWRDAEARMSLYAPDAVWDMSEGGVGMIEGREEIRNFFEEWLGAYEEYEQEVEEIQDLGNGVAFAVFRQRGRPAGSSGWVEFRDARVLLWADGRLERVNTFLDIDRARAAAERLAEERG
jgi:ketosteroid isomerase-like protein